MFYLPNDVSESNDILQQHPERAAELDKQWKAWDKGNTASRMHGYKIYHKERDQFFDEAMPNQ